MELRTFVLATQHDNHSDKPKDIHSGTKEKAAKLSDSEEEEEREQQSKKQNETNASACKISAVDNLSQDDEEIKIEIIESSDNLQSYSGCSAATTAVLNGSSPEPKENENHESDTQRANSAPSSPEDIPREPCTVNDVIEESNLSNPVDSDEKATEENNAADSVPAGTAGSASSSPASKTLSNTDRGQTDQSGPSSGVVTEIEAKLPNESTDADSTGDATNTPQEIPTTVEELVEQQQQQKDSPPAGDVDPAHKQDATPPCHSPEEGTQSANENLTVQAPKSPNHVPSRQNSNELADNQQECPPAVADKPVKPSEEDVGGAESVTPSPPDELLEPVGSPENEGEDDCEETTNVVSNNNDQVSKNSSEERESNNDDTSTLSESVPNTATNGGSASGIEGDNSSSRKESVNSDDTTIRTQVSFRESCLSRRSSSKSSIKKKVAYNDSTEVIPPPEYPPPEDDDSVFSDSVPPKLPRGDMCTPYATKRGSLPGMIALPDWFAEDRLMMEEGGIMEPPTTPIGRDELALRRHRFFSELLNAAHAAVEHRVRFDPLGPEVAKVPTEEESEDCDPDLKPSSARELECLIDRLERIVDRLERTVSARELEETRRILKDACAVGKAVIRSNTTVEEDTDPSADDLPTVLPSTPPPSASYLHQKVDSLESTLFPALTDQPQKGRQHNTTTVIQSKPSVLLNHTNPLTIQEQGTAVLSLSSSQHGTVGGTTSKMSINAYEDIMLGSFANFIALSNKIGGDVATQAQFVKEAFDAQFAFLKVASASSAPSNTDLQNLLKPTSDKISTIQSYREKNRTSPFFNHLSAISESIPALGWVCVAPTPGPYVKEMNDAGQFYTNRVLKDWKEKDSTHVEWARAWIQTLTELQQYIKQHHTTGLVWSGKDKPTVGGASVPPPPPPGGLPPPPPMMPLGDLSADGSGDDRSALFAQINQGADITKGLKKVTADMQTHKNPSLRSGPAPYKAPAGVTNGTKSVAPPAAAAVAKPPTFTRDGKKWLIEYQKNNPDLVVENAEMNNVVYMFRCEGSTLQIKGKINSVVMDSCKKCSLVFDSLVASAEFVNCQSVQMQVLGKVPTISIDKTDGCQMYLSADSLAVEIVSSKSSEMNVMIPKGSSGDYDNLRHDLVDHHVIKDVIDHAHLQQEVVAVLKQVFEARHIVTERVVGAPAAEQGEPWAKIQLDRILQCAQGGGGDVAIGVTVVNTGCRGRQKRFVRFHAGLVRAGILLVVVA
uniref:Adenylyl cyclase-associated protein n=1 Tax=Anopheles quadriannulatus TaxID=34691 RepID=A0A182XB21_ANOQN